MPMSMLFCDVDDGKGLSLLYVLPSGVLGQSGLSFVSDVDVVLQRR